MKEKNSSIINNINEDDIYNFKKTVFFNCSTHELKGNFSDSSNNQCEKLIPVSIKEGNKLTFLNNTNESLSNKNNQSINHSEEKDAKQDSSLNLLNDQYLNTYSHPKESRFIKTPEQENNKKFLYKNHDSCFIANKTANYNAKSNSFSQKNKSLIPNDEFENKDFLNVNMLNKIEEETTEILNIISPKSTPTVSLSSKANKKTDVIRLHYETFNIHNNNYKLEKSSEVNFFNNNISYEKQISEEGSQDSAYLKKVSESEDNQDKLNKNFALENNFNLKTNNNNSKIQTFLEYPKISYSNNNNKYYFGNLNKNVENNCYSNIFYNNEIMNYSINNNFSSFYSVKNTSLCNSNLMNYQNNMNNNSEFDIPNSNLNYITYKDNTLLQDYNNNGQHQTQHFQNYNNNQNYNYDKGSIYNNSINNSNQNEISNSFFNNNHSIFSNQFSSDCINNNKKVENKNQISRNMNPLITNDKKFKNCRQKNFKKSNNLTNQEFNKPLLNTTDLRVTKLIELHNIDSDKEFISFLLSNSLKITNELSQDCVKIYQNLLLKVALKTFKNISSFVSNKPVIDLTILLVQNLVSIKHLISTFNFKEAFLSICFGCHSSRVIQSIIHKTANIFSEESILRELVRINLEFLSVNKYGNYILNTMLSCYSYASTDFIFDYIENNFTKLVTDSEYCFYLIKNYILYLGDHSIIDFPTGILFFMFKRKKNLMKLCIKKLKYLAIHKFGHFIIIDLLEVWGYQFCQPLLDVLIRSFSHICKGIYGYAILKRVFVKFKKSIDFISHLSFELLIYIEDYDSALNYNLTKNIVIASIICCDALAINNLKLYYRNKFSNNNKYPLLILLELIDRFSSDNLCKRDRLLELTFSNVDNMNILK